MRYLDGWHAGGARPLWAASCFLFPSCDGAAFVSARVMAKVSSGS